MIGYSAECQSVAAQKLFDSSKSVLQLLFSSGVDWMKTLTRTVPSTFLHSDLNKLLLQGVLSLGYLGTRLKIVVHSAPKGCPLHNTSGETQDRNG